MTNTNNTDKANTKAAISLSIVTVCYNDLSGLKSTIESLSKIFAPNSSFEQIIVDGSSSDGTPDFLKTFNPPWPLKWVSEKDKGIYNAMNKGLDLASGEFVWFLNSGDEAQTNPQKFLNTNQITTTDLLYCKVFFVSDFGSRIVGSPVTAQHFRSGMPICHQGILYRTSLLKEKPYNEDYAIISDWISTRWFFESKKTCLFVNETIAKYNLQGLSSKNHKKMILELCRFSTNPIDRIYILATKGLRFFLIRILKDSGLFSPIKKIQHFFFGA